MTLGRSQIILVPFLLVTPFFLGFIFFSPISSFVMLQWCLCSYVPPSSFGISFPALLPQLSKVLEKQGRFFSCFGRWVVTLVDLWLGWGGAAAAVLCGVPPSVRWASESSAGWDRSGRARKDGGLSLEVCLLPELFATFAILFYIVKSYCNFGTLKNFTLGLSILIPNLNTWQLLEFGFPLCWVLCGVLMCYRMNEDHVLMSAGVIEPQNTARAPAFLGVWRFVRFGNPLTLFDSICLITASQNQHLSY